MAENPLNPENITGPDKAEKQATPTPKSIPKPDVFQSHMSEENTSAEKAGVMSPMDLAASGRPSLGTPTTSTLLNQVSSTQNTMSDVQGKLATPNLQLKRSQEHLLNNKLSDTTNHLQKASQTAGAKMVTPPEVSGKPSVVNKFINYVNHGQNQLLETKRQLEEMKSKGQNLQPGEMLLMQVNLAQAQQAIEYSSVLLSKAVDAIKQTINIQI